MAAPLAVCVQRMEGFTQTGTSANLRRLRKKSCPLIGTFMLGQIVLRPFIREYNNIGVML